MIDDKKISFNPDLGLMYAIQQTTGKGTDEILGFFFDFSKEVLRIGVENMKPNQGSIRKEICEMFPGLAIPFRILVTAYKHYGWKAGIRSTEPTMEAINVNITFPINSNFMPTTHLMDAIMERELLGGSGMPPFEPPKVRGARMYKKLMDEVLKDRIKDETK